MTTHTLAPVSTNTTASTTAADNACLHVSTLRMCTHPVNRAIVDFLRQHGTATKDQLACHLWAQGLPLMGSARLSSLAGRGVLVNKTVGGRGMFARYTLGPRASLFDVPPHLLHTASQPTPGLRLPEATRYHIDSDSDSECKGTGDSTSTTPAHTPWANPITPPPQYDVMRAPVYAPAPMGSDRPGANDHRACPSRGHLC